ncbi:MAG: hypothetical protein M3362_04390 [Acidobacteriota bacterium]|nr:hypothetical protein [Acidobacteriota bacterium]
MHQKIRLLSSTRAAATLALVLLFALVGCNKDSNNINSPVSANSNNANASALPSANAARDANASSNANASSTPAKPAGLSPTEVVRGYYEAGMRNDIASVKRFLSRGSLLLMQGIATREGKTLDQLFSEAARKEAGRPAPTFSNERITGDLAAVDVKTEGQPVVTMPLIKENGEWKLAFGMPKNGETKR